MIDLLATAEMVEDRLLDARRLRLVDDIERHEERLVAVLLAEPAEMRPELIVLQQRVPQPLQQPTDIASSLSLSLDRTVGDTLDPVASQILSSSVSTQLTSLDLSTSVTAISGWNDSDKGGSSSAIRKATSDISNADQRLSIIDHR